MSLSNKPTEQDLQLAKSLVHPDKTQRDEAFSTLKTSLMASKQMTDAEMMKLWKALYYCLWLADKTPIQQELSNNLSDFITIFPTKKLSMSYIINFYRIMIREWTLLDQYRVNKFYVLLRMMLNKSFQYMLSQPKPHKNIPEFTTILLEEVLLKVPNGIRYHISDIYLVELYKATNGTIALDLFLLFLQPYFQLIITPHDSTVLDRIYNMIFVKYIEEFSQEQQETSTKFVNVPTTVLQKKLFDLASDPETPERFRKRLYDLHRIYAKMSGTQFVRDDKEEEEELAAESMQVEEEAEPVVVEEEAPKKKGKKGKKAKEPEPEPQPEPEPEPVKPVKAKKGSKKVQEVTPEPEVVEEEAEEIVEEPIKPSLKKTTSKKNKSIKQSEPKETEEDDSEQLKNTKKRVVFSPEVLKPKKAKRGSK